VPATTQAIDGPNVAGRRRAWPGHSDTRAGLVLTVAVAVLYGWTVSFGFANDDFTWIQRARVLPGTRWWQAAFDHSVSPLFFRPLVQLSFFLDQMVFGTDPFWYHLTNLLLEWVTVLLVWRVGRMLRLGRLSSVLLASLFVAHAAVPIAVSWVCARSDLLCTACFLAALLAHAANRTALAATFFALAVASKETAIGFPVVAAVVDWTSPARMPWWRAARTYGVVLFIYLGVRATATAHAVPLPAALDAVARGDPFAALQMVGDNLVGVAQCLLKPLPLQGPLAVAALCLLIAVCLWSTRGTKERRTTILGVAWMVVGVVPFLGHFTFSAYYVYLASVGYALTVVSVGQAAIATAGRWKQRIAFVGLAVWLVASVVQLEQKNEQQRRNALMSARVIDAVVDAVPQPPRGVVLRVGGLGPLRLGHDPWARTPVLLFGLADALRTRFDDPTLDVAFDAHVTPETGPPLIELRWDAHTRRMLR